MPTVPTSFTPQVDVSTQGMPALEAPGVSAMRNAAPEQMQEMGRAQMQAGMTAYKIGERIQDEINEAETKAADVFALKQAMEIGTQYLNTKGKDAEAQYAQTQEQLAKIYADTEAQLTNDVQKKMFRQVAERNLLSFQGRMAEHKIREVTTYALGEAKSRAEAYVTLAINAYQSRNQKDDQGNPIGEFKTAVDTALAEMAKTADILGYDPEGSQAKDLQRSVYSQVTAGVVERLANDDQIAQAREFYDEQVKKDRLDLKTTNAIANFLDNVEDKIEFTTTLDQIVSGEFNAGGEGQAGTTARLADPVNLTVVSRGGELGAKRDGGRRIHNGIDLPVPVGTKVMAPYDGKVIQVWNDTKYGGGLSMRVQLDNGDIVGFAHLSSADVKDGRVTKGQVIARSGDTGTGDAHLHYTLKRNGQYIDPRKANDTEGGHRPGTPLDTSMESLDRTLEAIDKRYADRPIFAEQLKDGVKQKWREMNSMKDAREREVMDAAREAFFASGGDWTKIPNSIWAALPADAKHTFRKGLPRETDLDTEEWLIRNNNTFTEADLNARRDKLSRSDYNTWLARLQSRGPADPIEASASQSMIDNTLANAGLERFINPKSEEDKITANTIGQEIIRQIDAEQQIKGGKLSLKEKQAVVDRVIIQDVQVRNRVFSGSETRNIWDLSESEQERGFITVKNKGKDVVVPLAKIPPAQRQRIINSLRAANRPVTEYEIASLWVKAGSPQ